MTTSSSPGQPIRNGQFVSLPALTADQGDPTSATQWAVRTPDGTTHPYGDQEWVASGQGAEDDEPGSTTVHRAVTITYGPWTDGSGALVLPDGWERADGPGGLYCRLLAGDGLVVYADATGVLFAGRTSIEYQPGAARTLAARLIEAAGIVEQLQRGAR